MKSDKDMDDISTSQAIQRLEARINELEFAVESLQKNQSSTKAALIGLFTLFILYVITSR